MMYNGIAISESVAEQELDNFRRLLTNVGIYPDAIVDTITLCKETVKEVDPMLMTDFWSIYDDMNIKMPFLIDNNLTNHIITVLFESLQEFIKQYVNEDLEMDYFVNGEDSHFYINDEDLINIDVSTFKEE